MHMADALVSPVVAGTMYGLSTMAAAVSVAKVKKENETKKVALTGVMGAFVFAAQMINFSIPGTGSSGHLCGGMMLSAVAGPFAGFLTMIAVLLIQCLLFADGGILAFGCNVWNMAFYGCFLGSLLFWRPIMKNNPSKKKIVIASVLGCVLSLQLGAFSVTVQTLLSGITELPFKTFVLAMQPIHLAIGFVEGLITAAVLCFVFEARREILWGLDNQENKQRLTLSKVIAIVSVLALITGGAFSYMASEKPDGLEWSIEKITGSTEVESEGTVYEKSESVQEKTSILPDYNFKNSESEAGTFVSGVTGAAAVFCLCILAACTVRLFIRKKQKA